MRQEIQSHPDNMRHRCNVLMHIGSIELPLNHKSEGENHIVATNVDDPKLEVF